MAVWQYTVRRLIEAIPAMLGVTVIVFLLINLSGDPSDFMLPLEATAEDRAAYRKAYGLDKPLPVQYALYLSKVVQGDFGKALNYNEDAMKVVLRRAPNTLKIAGLAVIISTLIGLPAGIIAAINRNTPLDYVVILAAILGASIASFWMAMILIMVFAVWLGWLPVAGIGEGFLTGGWKNYILPSFTLSLWLMALMARLVRSGMLEVIRQDYIRTAYSKGLAQRVVLIRHALRNALIPVLTVMGLNIAFLIGGSIIVEIVFAWPGVGTLVYDSIIRRDYPIVMASVIFIGGAFIIINLLTDVAYAFVDPRIRYR